jgi:hypothetical protein
MAYIADDSGSGSFITFPPGMPVATELPNFGYTGGEGVYTGALINPGLGAPDWGAISLPGIPVGVGVGAGAMPGLNLGVISGALPVNNNSGGGNMALAALIPGLASAIPGILGAVGTAVGGTAGKAGSLSGASVVAQGRGYIVLQTASGKRVTIQRKKTSRRSRRSSGGMGINLNKMLQYKMMKDLMK